MARFAKFLLFTTLVFAGSAAAQQQPRPGSGGPPIDPNAPRPIDALESLWLEELTFMEVRDAIRAGKRTVIVPTGGVEENGPYLAAGKHNYILQQTAFATARKLGDALIAPIVAFVPQGNIDLPPAGMRYPGTIGVTPDTFKRLLSDIATSLRASGFETIILIGDSGGNQRGMDATAKALNDRWEKSGTRAHFIREFYSPGWEETEEYTERELGVAEGEHDGYHDDIWVTAMMMVTDPTSVRYEERLAADRASINGVDISDLDKTVELGRKMIEFRARHAAEIVRARISE